MNRPTVVLLILFWLFPLAVAAPPSCFAAMPVQQHPAAANPHVRLNRILLEPPFQQWHLRERQAAQKANPLWKAMGDQWNRFLKWLSKFFHPHHHKALHQRNNPATGFSFMNLLEIIGVILAAALVAGIVMVLMRWRGLMNAVPESAGGLLSRDKLQQAMEQGNALAMASDAWMQAAGQFGGEGDFRSMYRAMYLALLAGLHESGKIRFRRNWTNWRYVRDFRGDPAQRTVFGSLTDLFDHVWYGNKQYPGINSDKLRDQIGGLIQKEQRRA